MSDANAHRTPQNSKYPRCVDGRAGVVFLEQQPDHSWAVTLQGDDARAENGPQFLGASLLFVRALEEIAGRGRLRAFDLVEEASERAGLGLQIHLDDNHGEYDLANMTHDELGLMVQHHHAGCGFAAYAWGDAGSSVLSEAKRRGWHVQVLTGAHTEQGAVINHRAGETFDTAAAVADGAAQFNTDVAEARKVFDILERQIKQPGFADKAQSWMIDTYKDVVVALEGVKSPAAIAERH
jgi:hypothetical protein